MKHRDSTLVNPELMMEIVSRTIWPADVAVLPTPPNAMNGKVRAPFVVTELAIHDWRSGT